MIEQKLVRLNNRIVGLDVVDTKVGSRKYFSIEELCKESDRIQKATGKRMFNKQELLDLIKNGCYHDKPNTVNIPVPGISANRLVQFELSGYCARKDKPKYYGKGEVGFVAGSTPTPTPTNMCDCAPSVMRFKRNDTILSNQLITDVTINIYDSIPMRLLNPDPSFYVPHLGIKIDHNNLMDRESQFIQDEARRLAKEQGKRLMTSAEARYLIRHSTFDLDICPKSFFDIIGCNRLLNVEFAFPVPIRNPGIYKVRENYYVQYWLEEPGCCLTFCLKMGHMKFHGIAIIDSKCLLPARCVKDT